MIPNRKSTQGSFLLSRVLFHINDVLILRIDGRCGFFRIMQRFILLILGIVIFENNLIISDAVIPAGFFFNGIPHFLRTVEINRFQRRIRERPLTDRFYGFGKYDARQIAAILKHIVGNFRNAVGNGNIRERGTIAESAVIDGLQAGGKLDGCQRGAAKKGFHSDRSHVIRNDDIRKSRAILEHAVGNGGNAGRKCDVGQGRAKAESAVSDGKHGIGNGNFREGGAEEKCTAFNDLHAVFDHDLLQVIAFFANEFGNGFSAEYDLFNGIRIQKIISGGAVGGVVINRFQIGGFDKNIFFNIRNGSGNRDFRKTGATLKCTGSNRFQGFGQGEFSERGAIFKRIFAEAQQRSGKKNVFKRGAILKCAFSDRGNGIGENDRNQRRAIFERVITDGGYPIAVDGFGYENVSILAFSYARNRAGILIGVDGIFQPLRFDGLGTDGIVRGRFGFGRVRRLGAVRIIVTGREAEDKDCE